jgi:hypothetical protein
MSNRRKKKAKELLPPPRAIRLREKAASLEAKAEELLKEARALLAAAQEIEAENAPKGLPREYMDHIAARHLGEAATTGIPS